VAEINISNIILTRQEIRLGLVILMTI